jgi:hypothetical protein
LPAFFGNIDNLLYSIIVDDSDLIIIEPLKLLSNKSNVLTFTWLHDSLGNFHKICLSKSIFDNKRVFFLIEVKIAHKVGGKQVIHECCVCQFLRKLQNSSLKYPFNFFRTIHLKIIAIYRLVLTFINENILLMSFYHVLNVITEEQPVELFLIERMHEAEEFIYFLVLLDLN